MSNVRGPALANDAVHPGPSVGPLHGWSVAVELAVARQIHIYDLEHHAVWP
jgi:hypothetical protein